MCDSITDDVKSKEDVIFCGDGRMDSPGFSATKATYLFIEEGGSQRVVNMEHGDKRQVQGYAERTCIHRSIIIFYKVNLQSTNLEAHLYTQGLLKN